MREGSGKVGGGGGKVAGRSREGRGKLLGNEGKNVGKHIFVYLAHSLKSH